MQCNHLHLCCQDQWSSASKDTFSNHSIGHLTQTFGKTTNPLSAARIGIAHQGCCTISSHLLDECPAVANNLEPQNYNGKSKMYGDAASKSDLAVLRQSCGVCWQTLPANGHAHRPIGDQPCGHFYNCFLESFRNDKGREKEGRAGQRKNWNKK